MFWEPYMITAAQCEALALEYLTLSNAAHVSNDRTSLLKNVARNLKGLAGQLDRLDAIARAERR